MSNGKMKIVPDSSNIDCLEIQEISPVRVKVYTPQGSNFRQQKPHQHKISPPQKPSRRQTLSNPRLDFIDDQPDDNYDSNSKADSVGPSNGSTIYDEAVSRFQSIAALTEEQNNNLKEQNEYLLQKIRKMKQREQKIMRMYVKAKQYKKLYEESQIQLESVCAEREAYKQQAEQMKKIALIDVQKLREKLMKNQVRYYDVQESETSLKISEKCEEIERNFQ